LILCGRYDEVVPSCSETMHRGIPGSEWVLFEDSSHHAHLEEPERFYTVLRDFLARVEATSAGGAR
jgi:pimeloyl-ACP methyl ester carboxylesterase